MSTSSRPQAFSRFGKPTVRLSLVFLEVTAVLELTIVLLEVPAYL
jgi:hypothetical protein